jgi:hypothetical protein
MFQRMIYKKTINSDPEIVWLINAYKDNNGKFKAIIMRNYDISKAISNMPYQEVLLNKLRPEINFYNNIFNP